MSSKLVLEFVTALGETKKLTYSNAKQNPVKSDIKALANGIIANGSIFTNVPSVVKAITIQTTTAEEIDIS